MSKTPRLNGIQIVLALQRGGWVTVRERGTHARLHKGTGSTASKLTVPMHRPVKRSTLSHILKHAGLSVREFLRFV